MMMRRPSKGARKSMLDIVLIVLGVGLLIASAGYAAACDWL